MNEHLKPDEIEMLSRAEKATKGKWECHLAQSGTVAVSTAGRDSFYICHPNRLIDANPPRLQWEEDKCTDAELQRLANGFFVAAARTDLPTILTRLANERAKLAIAMEALESAWLAVRQGSAQETRNIIEDAIARINELEKQHAKT